MNIAEQVGFIADLIKETEALKFQSYGTQQRIKALKAVKATLVAKMNGETE